MQDAVIQARFGSGDHDLNALLRQTEERVEGVHHLGGIANRQEDFHGGRLLQGCALRTGRGRRCARRRGERSRTGQGRAFQKLTPAAPVIRKPISVVGRHVWLP